MTTATEITVTEGEDGVDVSFTTNLPPGLLCHSTIPEDGTCHVTIVAEVQTEDEAICAGNFDGIVIPQVIYLYSYYLTAI